MAGAAVVEVLGLADLEDRQELPAAGRVRVDLRDQAGQGVVEGVEEGGLGGDAGEARVLLPRADERVEDGVLAGGDGGDAHDREGRVGGLVVAEGGGGGLEAGADGDRRVQAHVDGDGQGLAGGLGLGAEGVDVTAGGEEDGELVPALDADAVDGDVAVAGLGVGAVEEAEAEVRAGVDGRVGGGGQEGADVEVGVGGEVHLLLAGGQRRVGGDLLGAAHHRGMAASMASDMVRPRFSGSQPSSRATRRRSATSPTRTREPG